MKNQIDGIDKQILATLQADGRMSMSQLAEVIGMSAPSVTERVRRLESGQILQNFTINIDPSRLGYSLEAIVRIKPRSGQLKQVEKMIEKQSRFVWCDRVTGDDCYIAKLMLKSINELDQLLESFHHCANR